MSNDQGLIRTLFEKYANGSASPEEIKQLFSLISDKQYDEEMKNLLLGELQETELQDNYDTDRWHKVFNKVKAETELMEFQEKPVRYAGLKRLAIAASVAACLGIGFYFYQHNQQPVPTNQLAKNDVAPGGNKAILTLSNGKQVSLTDAKNGAIAQQSGMLVNKTNNGQLVYTVSAASGLAADGGKTAEAVYNTVSTPRGGQYTLKLADGTLAVLDAASSIKYPVNFEGNERRVEITGQVYFEVMHNSEKPFRVTVKGQTVEDLGTHFNISAYDDEPAIVTTLVEGSVIVNKSLLKPGQEAVNNGTKITIRKADIRQAIAWKDGLFHFDQAALKTVMRQVSRWYDLDVVYQGNVADDEFDGEIPRNVKLSSMLQILKSNQIHFEIENTGTKKILIIRP